jgi:hypothetical protein
LGFLPKILDHHTTGTNNLSSISFTIEDAKSSPFSKFLPIGNFDEIDIVLGAESFDKLVVGLRVAGLCKNSKMCLTTVAY